MIPLSPEMYARVVLSASNLHPQHRGRKYVAAMSRFGGPRVYEDKGQEKYRHDFDFDSKQLRRLSDGQEQQT